MNFNTYHIKRTVRKKISISIRKRTKIVSTLCIKRRKPTKTQLKLKYRNVISKKCQKRFKALEQINRKLAANIRFMSANEQACQDIKLKYLKLKDKVLETEEELLKDGINTLEYPAFCSDEEDENSDIEIIEDPKFEQLLAFEMNTANKIPVNKCTQNLNNNKQLCVLPKKRLIKRTLKGNCNDKSSIP